MRTHAKLAVALLALLFAAGAPIRAAEPRVIAISTAHSALTLFTATNGALYQLSYGAAGRPISIPATPPAPETQFHPAYGDGFISEPALQATHADGNTSTDLIYVRDNATALDTNISLTRIELKDRFYPFFVTLCFKTYSQEDVIEQWSEIRNAENGPVTLYRFASAAPQLNAKEYWVTQFCGDYQREATLDEEKLGPGIKVLDSKIGVRASRFRNPSFILSLDGPAREDSGQAIGGSLEWSGSFQLAFEVDWQNRLRALCGINPFGSQYPLAAGQSLVTPAMLWTWSAAGKGQVSRNLHRWARRYGIRDGNKPRPLVFNNWEATYFKFDEKKIVSLFDGAHELGGELFLLDDGWFGNRHPRNNDHAGLGDWQVNTNKIPDGLSYLAREANKRGIQFGIWIEPEMVNPQSDLHEQHPEWAIGEPHREPELSRNQLVLDLTRPEVHDFAWRVLDDTFGPNPGIAYVKWDCNRYVTQPGSTWLKPEDQSRLLIDYNFALYDVMARMAAKYPNVMGMVCSGGSGRADYGALKYFHSFWPSDNTDPRSRVFIQWGFSHIFPAETISAHVTRMGNRPLKFALDVAMSGALGVDMDISKTTADERRVIADGIALYKKDIRPLITEGDLYRLESPYENPRAALDYVSPDRSRAVIFVYQLKSAPDELVKPRGLNPQLRYLVREVNRAANSPSQLAQHNQVLDGATLMRDGLAPHCTREFDSAVIELTPETADRLTISQKTDPTASAR
jgi:alpha-galactosidase